ncbi:hypothetical protein ACFFIY_07335 [Bhargavaea ullalensis]|uniref:YolD-like protein n=1 Tax=Bhargavaea ullalensis TaxID=1265685 RepID=A0ABV2GEZ0_9BACL
MPLIPSEALPHFENLIYLPMLLIILERDKKAFETGPFKLKRPYLAMVAEAEKLVQKDLKESRLYMRRRSMKLIKGDRDDLFTEYVFIHEGYEDRRRYLNVRLRNRSEELLGVYLTMGDRAICM